MKALIIEDETAAALNLKAILKQAAPDIRVVDTLESVEESVDWLRANPQPDLLFMDIHLADGDSFRIFDAVEVTAPVIFTTAYDRYALEAFKVNSIDYLLKPLNAADVQRALGKLMRQVGEIIFSETGNEEIPRDDIIDIAVRIAQRTVERQSVQLSGLVRNQCHRFLVGIHGLDISADESLHTLQIITDLRFIRSLARLHHQDVHVCPFLSHS